jgi:quercetin 2,3-dioxygenase
VLASGYEDGDALPIQADGRVMAAALSTGHEVTYTLEANRKAYLVPAKGCVRVNGVLAAAGDGLAIEDETVLVVSAEVESEVVLVEVA